MRPEHKEQAMETKWEKEKWLSPGEKTTTTGCPVSAKSSALITHTVPPSIYTEQFILGIYVYIHTYTDIHVITVKTETMNLKNSRYVGDLGQYKNKSLPNNYIN